MTTDTTSLDPGGVASAGALASPYAGAAGDNYLTHTRGLLSWVFTLDHKRIGVMYLVGILSSFLLAASWP